MSGYVKNFYETKYMSFLIKDDELKKTDLIANQSAIKNI